MSAFYKTQIIEKKVRKRILGYVKLKKRKIKKNNRMPFLQLHLVDHCNLKCKGCAHFSPIAQESFLDIEELDKMYRKLKPFLEIWFSRFELMGGEPLLHPMIEEIIILTRNYFPKIEIRLVTNGIKLMEMQESFFSTCANNRINIYISVYPISLDYEFLYKKLDSYDIAHCCYGEYEKHKTFIGYKLNPQGNYNRKQSYMKCKLGGRCLQLKNNRIYPCFLSAYSEHLNRFFHVDFKWENDDYLFLDNPITEADFHNFINNSVPFCRYCNMKQSLFKWGISQKSADEWLV